VPLVQGSPYVFTLDGKRPISGFSRAKARLDAHMVGVPAFVLHDVRRSVASGMQRLGISDAVIERALNHLSGVYRGVAGTYQRDPLTEPMREAFLRWSHHVSNLSRDQANVVTLAKKAKGNRRGKV
jgi:hypothetical protein